MGKHCSGSYKMNLSDVEEEFNVVYYSNGKKECWADIPSIAVNFLIADYTDDKDKAESLFKLISSEDESNREFVWDILGREKVLEYLVNFHLKGPIDFNNTLYIKEIS